MKTRLLLTCSLLLAAMSPAAFAEKEPTVGGAATYPTKYIVENAVNSKDNTTPVAGVQGAGLVNTLQGPGHFRVFARANETFFKFPPGEVDNFLKPESKAMLTKVLTYHLVRASSMPLN